MKLPYRLILCGIVIAFLMTLFPPKTAVFAGDVFIGRVVDLASLLVRYLLVALALAGVIVAQRIDWRGTWTAL